MHKNISTRIDLKSKNVDKMNCPFTGEYCSVFKKSGQELNPHMCIACRVHRLATVIAKRQEK